MVRGACYDKNDMVRYFLKKGKGKKKQRNESNQLIYFTSHIIKWFCGYTNPITMIYTEKNNIYIYYNNV